MAAFKLFFFITQNLININLYQLRKLVILELSKNGVSNVLK